jgi:hypothetical protein
MIGSGIPISPPWLPQHTERKWKAIVPVRCERFGTISVAPSWLPRMFLFFSNGIGIAGSIVVSIAVTLLLLYACSGP